MRRSAVVLLGLPVLLMAAGSACAQVLNFEDLWPGQEGSGPLPNPYLGFTLTDGVPYVPWWVTKNAAGPSGYQNTIEGRVGVSSTLNGLQMRFSRAVPFDVGTIKIGAAWNDDRWVRILGMRGDEVVDGVWTGVDYAGETLALSFTGITTLAIVPDLLTGVDHDPGDGGWGHDIVVDNITLYQLPPPRVPVADAGEDQWVEQQSPAGAQVTLDGTASTGWGPLTYRWYDQTTFLGSGAIITPTLAPGFHGLQLEVTDERGVTDCDTCLVMVADWTAPDLTLTVLKPTIWPANHKLVLAARVTGVSDAGDADPTVDINVTANEPIAGPGDPNPDWIVVRNGGVWDIWLRAERIAPSADRVYMITATATDDSGNWSQRTGAAVVPGGGGKRK